MLLPLVVASTLAQVNTGGGEILFSYSPIVPRGVGGCILNLNKCYQANLASACTVSTSGSVVVLYPVHLSTQVDSTLSYGRCCDYFNVLTVDSNNNHKCAASVRIEIDQNNCDGDDCYEDQVESLGYADTKILCATSDYRCLLAAVAAEDGAGGGGNSGDDDNSNQDNEDGKGAGGSLGDDDDSNQDNQDGIGAGYIVLIVSLSIILLGLAGFAIYWSYTTPRTRKGGPNVLQYSPTPSLVPIQAFALAGGSLGEASIRLSPNAV